MPDIAQSVGVGGQNQKADVRIVQALLNNFAHTLGINALAVDGACGTGTVNAIKKFQSQIMGVADPNGRLDPGGRTITALNRTALSLQLSGAAWWHANQGKYVNSERLDDLEPVFRDKAKRFVTAMRTGGAQVLISSTRRNKIRAYLMHYSWAISEGEIAAANVPAEAGCTIIWDHGNVIKSKAAAKDMKELFNIAYKPSLTSRHIDGKAIDMTISWAGTLRMADGQGRPVSVPPPSPGSLNAMLHRVGASYGVIKLLGDPPHWSSDGR